MSPVRRISLFAVALTTTHCAWFAVHAAPEKVPVRSTTEAAVKAKAGFWEAFHAARYEALPGVTEALTRAYLEQPNDPDLTLLLAHAHFWKIAERTRLTEPYARITDEMVLADWFFSEAKRLRPDDRRIDGWQGGVWLALGSIHKDEKLTRQGFFRLQDAAHEFPEFNEFSASFAMSSIPPTDSKFAGVVEHMWRNMERCVGSEVSRTDPVLKPSEKGQDFSGDRRVCANSEVAPHNTEGFFLAFGDVVSKSGDAPTARKLYENAKVAPSYSTWPLKKELEDRVENVETRTQAFRSSDKAQWPHMMIDSNSACTGCHAG